MERRIDGADHDREAVHGFEQAGEIAALHAQELGQGLAAILFGVAQDHGLHVRQPVLGEEHVLGAAQADALSAEAARRFGVARDIGIGADAEAAAERVGHLHELGEHRRIGVGILGGRLALVHIAVGAVDGNPVAFFNGDLLSGHLDDGGFWRAR